MEVDPPQATAAAAGKSSSSSKDKPRFEVKKVRIHSNLDYAVNPL
jgi:hypothetical protein